MSSNLLDKETSPYLLLHAGNPVHWRPWGAEALAEAEAANKPILLSIGYTACHWCHVMNHESFTDPETALLMNEHFVNIKVDREERPDIDQLYQTAANTMGLNGGWPLTMFLTPKGEPFFGGSYYPKEPRYGQPAFKAVLEQVSKIYREQPDAVANTHTRVNQTLNEIWARDSRSDIHPQILDHAAIHATQRFDVFYGGITGAPKFPSTPLLELMWRAYLRTGASQFFQLVHASLDNMCMGGIYDHVGGGFARYATDERWLVPHFEKMLYDNALLIDMLTMVWQHSRNPLYRERVEETIAWLLRDMKVEDGFASSLDADSEGEEGKYYLWTEAEIDAALKGTHGTRFKEIYNVRRQGNLSSGGNILNRAVGGVYPQSEADEAMLKRQRELLLAARMTRTPPLRDDKVLADWNGMAIAALANAGAAMRNPEWIEAAIKAFDFVVKALGDDGRLYHAWRENIRKQPGFSDDYAHMARAALTLWEVTQEKRFLDHAHAWIRTLNDYFWDAQNGGYFYTPDDAEPLLVRIRSVYDSATPSANGVMATVLGKMHVATSDPSYRDRANALVQAFGGELERNFMSTGTFLNGLETIMTGLQIVVLGDTASAKTRDLVAAVWGRSLPARVLVVANPNKGLPEGHPAYGKTMENGLPTAYICSRNTCSAPITSPVTLSQALTLPARPAGQA